MCRKRAVRVYKPSFEAGFETTDPWIIKLGQILKSLPPRKYSLSGDWVDGQLMHDLFLSAVLVTASIKPLPFLGMEMLVSNGAASLCLSGSKSGKNIEKKLKRFQTNNASFNKIKRTRKWILPKLPTMFSAIRPPGTAASVTSGVGLLLTVGATSVACTS